MRGFLPTWARTFWTPIRSPVRWWNRVLLAGRELRDFLGPAYFEENGDVKTQETAGKNHSRRPVPFDRECHPPSPHRAGNGPAMASTARAPARCDHYFRHSPALRSGPGRQFHTIILVYTSREIQLQRLMARDGLSREEALKKPSPCSFPSKPNDPVTSDHRQQLRSRSHPPASQNGLGKASSSRFLDISRI